MFSGTYANRFNSNKEIDMLTQEQVDFYNENGYLKVDQLFTSEETKELASEMVHIINNWGQETIGWPGTLAYTLPRRRGSADDEGCVYAQSALLFGDMG